MNERERFIEAIQFRTPDRLPLLTMGPRESTLARWYTEGLPAGADWKQELLRQLGIAYEFPRQPRVGLGVTFTMLPQFEEKVLEHRDGHVLVQDWMGNITEISDQFDVTYIREARDFVTRKWHRFPVETRADFAAMRRGLRHDERHLIGAFAEDNAVRRGRVIDRLAAAMLFTHGSSGRKAFGESGAQRVVHCSRHGPAQDARRQVVRSVHAALLGTASR